MNHEPAGDAAARTLVRELLRDALEAEQRGTRSDARVRQRLRDVCDCARRESWPVERLLVALKDEWRETSEVRRLPRMEATAVLERVVTLCIREFYDGRPAH